MSKFEGVTVVKEANVYFDGKVTSRTILFSDGSRKTLGILLPGEYEFPTDEKEIVELLSGGLEFSLSEDHGWESVGPGESFEVPAQTKFKVKVKEITDYCCSYISG
jgi:uncharacterized protein YaiE (UPF0345 family)